MPQARRAPRSDAFDPERSMQLRRSIGIPALPNVKTACSRRGILPPSHIEGHMPVYIGRRILIAALGSAATWPLAAHAQRSHEVRRVGVIMGFAENDEVWQAYLANLRQGLQELGWSDGRNIRFDYRFTGESGS